MDPGSRWGAWVFAAALAVVSSAAVGGARAGTAQFTTVDLANIGSATIVNAVSSSGQFVGQMPVGATTHAFSWTQADGMVDLGVLPGGAWSAATVVNDRGEVAGMTGMQNGDTYAFVWTKQNGTVGLGTIRGGERPLAISNTGEIVGSSRTPSGYPRPFVWTARDGMADIGTLGGEYGSAVDVNDSGLVVGWADLRTGETHAFAWTTAGGMVDLGTLGGSGTPGNAYSAASAVNASGQIVGSSRTAAGRMDAVVWTPSGGIVDVASYASATAVNAAGQVIGFMGSGAFSWTASGGLVELGGRDVRPSAVTDTGMVVGMMPIDYYWHAFAWTRSRGMLDLGTLPGGTFGSALAANDAGQVFGYGWLPGEQHAIRWDFSDATPPDAPTVPDLAAAADSGSSNADDVTNQRTLVLNGTAEASSTVTLYRDANAVRTVSADSADGSWSVVDTVTSDGTYGYSATATDPAGNVSTASNQRLVTIDTVAPHLTVPTIHTVDATTKAGAFVDFVPSADDGQSQAPAVVCEPRSGSLFGLGDSTVTCIAADVAGNVASATFVVHVRGASEQIDRLRAAVIGVGPGSSLADKLAVVRAAFVAGEADGALSALEAFTNEIAAQTGKTISTGTAPALTADARRIANVLG